MGYARTPSVPFTNEDMEFERALREEQIFNCRELRFERFYDYWFFCIFVYETLEAQYMKFLVTMNASKAVEPVDLSITT